MPLDVPNPTLAARGPVPRSGGIAMMAGVFFRIAILRPRS